MAVELFQYIFLNSITVVEGVRTFFQWVVCTVVMCLLIIVSPRVSTVTYCMLHCPQTCIFRSLFLILRIHICFHSACGVKFTQKSVVCVFVCACVCFVPCEGWRENVSNE
jgi:hypothetical protein